LLEMDRMSSMSHSDVHKQIDESTRVALENLNGRLNGFPQEYASKLGLAEVKDQLGKLSEDIRLRMEAQQTGQSAIVLALERRLVEGLQLTREEARREVRPVQDKAVATGGIVAAIAFGVMILGAFVLLANFVTARP